MTCYMTWLWATKMWDVVFKAYFQLKHFPAIAIIKWSMRRSDVPQETWSWRGCVMCLTSSPLVLIHRGRVCLHLPDPSLGAGERGHGGCGGDAPASGLLLQPKEAQRGGHDRHGGHRWGPAQGRRKRQHAEQQRQVGNVINTLHATKHFSKMSIGMKGNS